MATPRPQQHYVIGNPGTLQGPDTLSEYIEGFLSPEQQQIRQDQRIMEYLQWQHNSMPALHHPLGLVSDRPKVQSFRDLSDVILPIPYAFLPNEDNVEGEALYPNAIDTLWSRKYSPQQVEKIKELMHDPYRQFLSDRPEIHSYYSQLGREGVMDLMPHRMAHEKLLAFDNDLTHFSEKDMKWQQTYQPLVEIIHGFESIRKDTSRQRKLPSQLLEAETTGLLKNSMKKQNYVRGLSRGFHDTPALHDPEILAAHQEELHRRVNDYTRMVPDRFSRSRPHLKPEDYRRLTQLYFESAAPWGFPELQKHMVSTNEEVSKQMRDSTAYATHLVSKPSRRLIDNSRRVHRSRHMVKHHSNTSYKRSVHLLNDRKNAYFGAGVRMYPEGDQMPPPP